ncbi:hypothetical protein [Bartonella sp. A05]|uniref:hypothetical protein n=1 Tax=Bartonella sp. A05 TaxID=2967261 RepID=UPI0022A9B149|nr:hypothetical protein [Bartonella sp. A05]MCZ2204025.1 hypothetical protein [Bartonella sp. A05]
MIKYFYAFIVMMFLGILPIKTFAATIKNADSKAQLLIVSEGSVRSNVSLNPDQTVTICIKGCFITFPNKDHFAVKSEDTIEINNGRAFFQ